MTHWKQIPISELGEVYTGRTPPSKNPAYFGEEYPFITPSDMDGRKIISVTERYLSESGAKLLNRIKLPANAVCVSCIGWQMGKTIMTSRPSFTNQQINSIVPNDKILPDFLYYSLKPRKDELLSLGSAIGVRTPILNKSEFSSLKVAVPSLDIQRKITAVLSAYDDLIENNSRRIAILEEMAQRLYREWFGHGQVPGTSEVPGTFDPRDGRLPEGWRSRQIQDFGKVITGKTPSKNRPEYYDEEYMPFIKTPAMHGNIFCTETTEYLSKQGADSQANKTLPPDSICVTCIGTVGIISITAEPSQTNQQINSIVLKNLLDREFLYFALVDLGQKMQLYGATGATMTNLSKGKFQELEVIYPSYNIIQKFHEITFPVFENIKLAFRLKNLD